MSADGSAWFLFNASPDLRQQIEQTPALHPNSKDGLRSSPIAGVILTGGDVDAIAGLLTLRERHAFGVYATAKLHAVLNANPIFAVLAPELVSRAIVPLDTPTALAASGLTIELFAVPGKTPLYLEEAGATPPIILGEDTVGALVSDGQSRLAYVPGCAAMTAELAERLDGVDAVFFDGTLWRDDEMIRAGLGAKTGRRMGHMSVSGPDGAIAAFAPLKVKRKIFIHINNSNPILVEDSPERAEVGAAGWQVAHDGMELRL